MDAKSVQLAAFVFMALIVLAMGQGCPTLAGYSSCLRFVRKDNNYPAYNSPCCQLIRGTTQDCLCNTAKNNGNLLDIQKALSLPKACGRKVPPNTYCGGYKVPN